ncbi:hypothetical protein [Treponema sp.]|uniref:hypothetical protein n=1 Tax=Treponema sp. TaxID=166 RepID=UPI00388D2C2C
MCFIFSGKDKKFCEHLYEQIADIDDAYFFFENGLDLLKNITGLILKCDILFLDYEMYKDYAGFIYDIFCSKNLILPIILLGDKRISAGLRVARWVSENEFYYNVQTLHTMLPVFNKINDALNSCSLEHTVEPVIMPEVKDKKSLETFPDNNNLVEKINQELHLNYSMLKLLNLFHERYDTDVSIEEILLSLSIQSDSEKENKNLTYAYISRLRKHLKLSSYAQLKNVQICRSGKGFYRMIMN